jgi:hypothetical protein
VVEQDNEITYMVFFEDLFICGDPIDRFHEVSKKRPCECCECESDQIVTLEVLGAEKPLFWVCLECDALYLKESIETTLKELECTSGTWTNPNDWGQKNKDEFN